MIISDLTYLDSVEANVLGSGRKSVYIDVDVYQKAVAYGGISIDADYSKVKLYYVDANTTAKNYSSVYISLWLMQGSPSG